MSLGPDLTSPGACTDRAGMESVTVYYAPTCSFSASVVAFLLTRGADFRLVNVADEPGLRGELERRLGGRTLETPIIQAGGALHVTPTPKELVSLLEAWGLPASSSPHEKLKRLAQAQPPQAEPREARPH